MNNAEEQLKAMEAQMRLISHYRASLVNAIRRDPENAKAVALILMKSASKLAEMSLDIIDAV